MNIVFYSNQLGERGTETALIDYAMANEEYSSNHSLFAFPANRIFDQNRYAQLSQRFKILLFSSVDEFNQQLKEEKIDLVYVISGGKDKDIADEITAAKTFVHCVFTTQRRHGTYYCGIHPFLNKYFHTNFPVLPHIVKPFPPNNDSFREELKIPNDAIVFGYYGGSRNFNIPFAQEAIKEIAKTNQNIFFVFMNITDFICDNSIKNIIFLPGSTDLTIKEKFIKTCSAMIHARADGETFGLSVAEFSILNKPVVTYKPPLFPALKDYINSFRGRLPVYSTAHLMNLGKKAITYSSKKQLLHILTHFSEYISPNIDYDCFSKPFAAEKVINQFFDIINK